MYIHDLQDNGKYGHTIIYTNKEGKIVSQSNCYFCCSGEITETLDDERIFCIYFECINPNEKIHDEKLRVI